MVEPEPDKVQRAAPRPPDGHGVPVGERHKGDAVGLDWMDKDTGAGCRLEDPRDLRDCREVTRPTNPSACLDDVGFDAKSVPPAPHDSISEPSNAAKPTQKTELRKWPAASPASDS